MMIRLIFFQHLQHPKLVRIIMHPWWKGLPKKGLQPHLVNAGRNECQSKATKSPAGKTNKN
ncbi:MAG: hypothetical protein B7X44_01045 [Halothiobacillus sp. 15-55-196]|nr:MAG: hypothetical protein B7X44_01045 [Halothiobacillus sp. 15-55-196]